MAIEDGGPAFPTGPSGAQWTADDGKTFHQHEPLPGMTLRDYFAGQALAGVTTNQSWVVGCLDQHKHTDHNEAIANVAYKLADAMLAARKLGEEITGE